MGSKSEYSMEDEDLCMC